jgi:hypothetical protein
MKPTSSGAWASAPASSRARATSHNPKSYTLHPTPYTPTPKPQILNPQPSTPIWYLIGSLGVSARIEKRARHLLVPVDRCEVQRRPLVLHRYETLLNYETLVKSQMRYTFRSQIRNTSQISNSKPLSNWTCNPSQV